MPNTVVKMPQLGESVSEGTIGRWLKQPGDRVERDEPLVEIQTDKVNAEVPSPVAGILRQILLPEGTTAAVKTDMAVIGDEAPSDVEAPPAPQAPPAPAPPAPSPSPTTFSYDKSSGGGVVGHREEEPASAPPQPATNGTPQKRFYTPVVLRMAEEHALDLSTIEGTGAHGRVTRKDVERAIAGQTSRAPSTPPVPLVSTPTTPPPADGAGVAPPPQAPDRGRIATPPPGAITAGAGSPPATPSTAGASSPPAANAATADAGSPPQANITNGGLGSPQVRAGLERSAASDQPFAANDEDLPLTPMRRAIAEHMARARADIPDAWSIAEIDMTRLVKYRDSLQAEWQAREAYELTYLPFFIKAVLAGLRKVPELNASWAGDHVRLHREYNLGIAVSVQNGLVVPVLRGADQLSIAGLARALRTIVQKARSGRLAMDDLQGATFSVNNPGSLGSIMSQPIVPVGHAGIVTMEAIVKRPVVTTDDAIAVRSMMYSCISFDHRVLDGAGALIFLRTIKHELETVEYPLY